MSQKFRMLSLRRFECPRGFIFSVVVVAFTRFKHSGFWFRDLGKNGEEPCSFDTLLRKPILLEYGSGIRVEDLVTLEACLFVRLLLELVKECF